MSTTTITKQFWQNVLPSMTAFAFTGIYSIVDGIFVGRSVGDVGLAAINIAYPITSLIQSMGTGIGMAGAILIAISQGRKETHTEKLYLGNTLLLLLLMSIAMMTVFSFLYLPVLTFFGAKGILYEHAAAYLKIIVMGTVFQMIATGLVPIIRNYNGAFFAMVSMVTGFISNIFLDWLFVSQLSYGTSGAALATVLSQGITLLFCMIFFACHKAILSGMSLRLTKKTFPTIFLTALSPFGLTFSPSIIIAILNKGAIVYGDELSVACYAVISYVTCVLQLLFQGIGDGTQPLLGNYYGSENNVALKKVLKLSYCFSLAVGFSGVAVLFLLNNQMPYWFGTSPEVASQFQKVVPCFYVGLLFVSYLRITISYFYATEKNTFASILIYGEPTLLAIFIAFVFPTFLGINGVWLSVPITQFLLMCLAIFFRKNYRLR